MIKTVDDICVHASHCCRKHGCKYGDDDCPVAAGTIEQEYDCEDGHEDNPCRGMSRLDKVTAERDGWKALAQARSRWRCAQDDDGRMAALRDIGKAKAELLVLGVPEMELL
jgi:hypothetical protein